jgi:apolipoprotein N-acyltransferase
MGELWMLDLTAPGYLVVFLIGGAGLGLVAVVAGSGDDRTIRLVAAVVLLEWLRWSFPFGGVPLATVPMTQADSPLAAVLPLGGGLLLTAVTVAAGSALRLLLERRFDLAALAAGAVTVTVIVGTLVPTGSPIDTIDVAVVQGGGPQRTRANRCENQAVFDRHVEATRSLDRRVDLLVWPENVVNPIADGTPLGGCADLFFMSEAIDDTTTIARTAGATFIPGWFHSDGPRATVNYSTAVAPTGEVVDRYDKERLVPFGEFVPLRSFVERFSDDLPARDVRPGDGPPVLRSPVGTLGVAISWEVFFESRARDAIDNGAEVLLNPTNGSSYWLTILQSQQIATSRNRARETGRWVLQAAPTGFSAIIEPDGRVLERTGISEQTVLTATIELREGRTPASRLGPAPWLILALVVLVGVRARSVRSRARRSPD